MPEEEVRSTETRLAVIETDIKYIKGSIEELSEKLDNLDFSKSFEKQGERIGAMEREVAILDSKVKGLLWGVTIVGSTAIAALTTALIKLLGVN